MKERRRDVRIANNIGMFRSGSKGQAKRGADCKSTRNEARYIDTDALVAEREDEKATQDERDAVADLCR